MRLAAANVSRAAAVTVFATHLELTQEVTLLVSELLVLWLRDVENNRNGFWWSR